MDYYNFLLNIFYNIILFDIFLKLFIIFNYMFKILFYKSMDIYIYKINNLFRTFILVFIYVLIFILCSYLFKVFNIGKYSNLKQFTSNCVTIFEYIFNNYAIIIILILLLIILILLLIFMLILKFFTREIFKLHLYYNQPIYKLTIYITPEKPISLFKKIYIILLTKLEALDKIDLISYMLIIIVRKITVAYHGPLYDRSTKQVLMLWKYHPYEIINKLVYMRMTQILITISPLFFIFYDCIFNDFIIIHVYYYLLFYTPLMIIKKMTIFLSNYSQYVGQVFWLIYYEKSNKNIYAIPQKYLPLLQAYIKSGLSSRPFIKTVSDVFTESNNTLFLLHLIEFELYNEERQTYMNVLGNYIQITSEGKVFEELEDDTKFEDYIYLGEEWILLADNRFLP